MSSPGGAGRGVYIIYFKGAEGPGRGKWGPKKRKTEKKRENFKKFRLFCEKSEPFLELIPSYITERKINGRECPRKI